jgi:hypothetical protein
VRGVDGASSLDDRNCAGGIALIGLVTVSR